MYFATSIDSEVPMRALIDMQIVSQISELTFERERKAMNFCRRTGLDPRECMLVQFKGKEFIQWKSAVLRVKHGL